MRLAPFFYKIVVHNSGAVLAMSVQPYLRECEISDALPMRLPGIAPKTARSQCQRKQPICAATSAVAVGDIVQSLPCADRGGG